MEFEKSTSYVLHSDKMLYTDAYIQILINVEVITDQQIPHVQAVHLYLFPMKTHFVFQ